MLWRILVAPVLALALAGAAACGDDDETPTETTAPAATGTGIPTGTPADTPTDAPTETTTGTTTDGPTASPSGASTGEPTEEPTVAATLDPDVIIVAARDFAFDPATIAAEAGEAVEIKFGAIGTENHTFTIDALDVDLALSSGETGTVEFVFPNQPTEFYCRIHPLLMSGMLEPGG